MVNFLWNAPAVSHGSCSHQNKFPVHHDYHDSLQARLDKFSIAVIAVESAVKYYFFKKCIQTRRKGQHKPELTRLHVKPLITAITAICIHNHDCHLPAVSHLWFDVRFKVRSKTAKCELCGVPQLVAEMTITLHTKYVKIDVTSCKTEEDHMNMLALKNCNEKHAVIKSTKKLTTAPCKQPLLSVQKARMFIFICYIMYLQTWTNLVQYKHRVQTAKRQYHTREFLQDNLLSVKCRDWLELYSTASTTSFSGSLISGGGKMRDPGNEVDASIILVSSDQNMPQSTKARQIRLQFVKWLDTIRKWTDDEWDLRIYGHISET